MTVAQAAGSGAPREPNDLYETPEDVTRAVLPLLRDFGFPTLLWEPACGHGKMAEVLRRDGYSVTATDLVDYGYGRSGVDYLATPSTHAAVVTNPPWKLAHEFVFRSLDIPFLALLLKDTFWQPRCREGLWRARQPDLIAQLTWRPDWTGSRRPYFSAAWSIWTPNHVGGTEFCRLERPE